MEKRKRKASKGKEKRVKDEEQDDQERHQSRKSQTEAQPVASNPREGREECHTALVLSLTLLITTPPRWSAERLTRSVRRSLRTAGASAELAHSSRRHSVQRTFTVLSISALTSHELLTRANLFWTCVFLSELSYIWKHHKIEMSPPQFVLKQCSAFFYLNKSLHCHAPIIWKRYEPLGV